MIILEFQLFNSIYYINKILCDIDDILDKNTAGGNTVALISKWLDGLNEYWEYKLPANSKFKKPQIVAF